MGKRSNFKRRDRDAYPTPHAAVVPLLPHLSPGTVFTEPCAGNGVLVRHLEAAGHGCQEMFDIEPMHRSVAKGDVFDVTYSRHNMFITNPPWDRKILHPLIDHLSAIAPTWLLFDASWAYTKQSAEYMKGCQKMVAVGRVKWIPDSKMTGKDDCAWYLFRGNTCATEFIGR